MRKEKKKDETTKQITDNIHLGKLYIYKKKGNIKENEENSRT